MPSSHRVRWSSVLFALAACGDGSKDEAGAAGTGGGAGAIATSVNQTSTIGGQAGASGTSSAGASARAGAQGVSTGAGGAPEAGAGGASGPSAAAGTHAAAGSGGQSSAAGAGGNSGSGGSAGVSAVAGGGAGGSAAFTGGPSRCAGSQLLLCEDFEADDLDSSVWSTKIMPPALDDTRAARGSKSLHVHTGATGAAGIETKKIFPRPEGHYYGRMFVYFDALPTSPQWAHWTIVGANPTSGSGEIRVGGQHDGKIERFGVGTDQGPTGDWTNLDKDPDGAGKSVPLQEWLCVEWLHDWASDVTRFYLDGAEHPSLATTKDVDHGGNSSVAYEIPELGSVWVGFWNYDQNKPVEPSEFDTWIDEVALDDERIGCDH